MKVVCKIAERLKEVREDQKISQKKLADAIGFNQSAISMWETGARLPDIESVMRLSIYFQVSSDYLLGLVD